MTYVYRLQNRETGHYYIGICVNLKSRMKSHRAALSKGGANWRFRRLLETHPTLRSGDAWSMRVLGTHSNRHDAGLEEWALLKENMSSPLCLNERLTTPSHGSVTRVPVRPTSIDVAAHRAACLRGQAESRRRGFEERRQERAISRARRFFDWLRND